MRPSRAQIRHVLHVRQMSPLMATTRQFCGTSHDTCTALSQNLFSFRCERFRSYRTILLPCYNPFFISFHYIAFRLFSRFVFISFSWCLFVHPLQRRPRRRRHHRRRHPFSFCPGFSWRPFPPFAVRLRVDRPTGPFSFAP
jgi:hypothetical protein